MDQVSRVDCVGGYQSSEIAGVADVASLIIQLHRRVGEAAVLCLIPWKKGRQGRGGAQGREEW